MYLQYRAENNNEVKISSIPNLFVGLNVDHLFVLAALEHLGEK